MAIGETIKGAIKVAGVPASACFSTFAELLQSLGQYLTVELPVQSFSNVVISNQQPGDTDRNKLWVRRSNSGSIQGVYIFAAGVWEQLFPAPHQVFWLLGNSDTPPAGYVYMDLDASGLTSPQYTALFGNAVLSDDAGIYPALFVGV